ncbi:MAG: serine acetyltransferase [Methylophaga sp.]|nr:MAG: serine acetyltransferase [Methylophaga sp.]
MISTSEPEWKRELPRGLWDPSRKYIKAIRDYQKFKVRSDPLAIVGRKIAVLRYLFWVAVSGADIPINCKLGGGLSIPHPNTEIGVNCLIHQQVTIGVNRGDTEPPKISGHVDIGAGAKIIGNITIGPHALIGANAVVVKDVQAYSIVAGVPAKVTGYTNQSEHS